MPVAAALLTLDLEAAIPAAPLMLVTTAHPSLRSTRPTARCTRTSAGSFSRGTRSSIEETAAAGIPWAADNDCFQGLDAAAFVRMLDRIAGLPGCLFVTVPDVVGDAARDRSTLLRQLARAARAPRPARRARRQDGSNSASTGRAGLAPPRRRVHRRHDRMQRGRRRRRDRTRGAERGLWVHWGRVNTRRRLDLIVATGAADSFDGSKFARFRNTYLDGPLRELVALADLRELGIELAARSARAELMAELGDVLANADQG